MTPDQQERARRRKAAQLAREEAKLIPVRVGKLANLDVTRPEAEEIVRQYQHRRRDE